MGGRRHAGRADQRDRWVGLMEKRGRMREVVAVPESKEACCLLTRARKPADDKQLEELGLLIRGSETTEE